mmetsp:Transcript_41191/g.74443  ORF Transcript_41191/g.74443 Transcript_41191/m.74443 type:complete len:653 (+) Transcript_41191:99-2057(+)
MKLRLHYGGIAGCVNFFLLACLQTVQAVQLHSGAEETSYATLLQRVASSEAEAPTAPLFHVKIAPDIDADEGVTVVVDPDTDGLLVKAGIEPTDGLAWASLRDRLDVTGWIELTVQASQSARVPNGMRMYGAGLLEGLTTARRISQFYANGWQLLNRDDASARAMKSIRRLFQVQLDYLKEKTNLAGGNLAVDPPSAYWKQVRYMLLQMWGIRDGYNLVAKQNGVNEISLVDLFIINAHAELPELIQAYAPEAVAARKAWQGGTKVALAQTSTVRHPAGTKLPEPPAGLSQAEVEEWVDRDWEQRLIKRGHCSALVRVTGGTADLMAGHTTWSDYSKMTRIYKYYHFRLPGSDLAAESIGFSSYPGCVSSTDDFYMLSSGLVIMDTTLEVLNADNYLRVPEFPANPTVPTFLHVMAVNRISTSGAAWCSAFAGGGTGTASAQWMVVDYNKFVPGKPVSDRVVWIVEKIPGVVKKGDVSGFVRQHGYWASYNRPYFEEVRRITGHQAAEQKYGALYSFDRSPRGAIFSHLGPAAENLIDMRHIMNRNAFPNEGVSPSSPGHSISARMDLQAPSAVPNGGIDAKVTNRCLLRLMQCQAISGPTHETQPIFKWASDGVESFPGWPHYGLPDVWNFDWVQMTPSVGFTRIVDILKC